MAGESTRVPRVVRRIVRAREIRKPDEVQNRHTEHEHSQGRPEPSQSPNAVR